MEELVSYYFQPRRHELSFEGFQMLQYIYGNYPKEARQLITGYKTTYGLVLLSAFLRGDLVLIPATRLPDIKRHVESILGAQ